MPEPLIDSHGRKITQLRVSVTDRCDMACRYCRPSGADKYHPDCDLAPLRHLQRIVGVFARLGVRKVRVTGGEPLLRKGIFRFLEEISILGKIEKTAITTNGTQLARYAQRLRQTGLSGINVSLDSLNKKTFREITGRNSLGAVLEGIDKALDAGFDQVKINVVALRGINDNELVDFARLTLVKPLEVRFIEFMPATPRLWNEKNLITVEEIKNKISVLGDLIPMEKDKFGGPAKIYRLPTSIGSIGFISTVSDHFCGDCNRLRITSKAKLMNCLFGNEVLDLRKLIEDGATDDIIIDAIRQALLHKKSIRSLPSNCGKQDQQVMTSIGG